MGFTTEIYQVFSLTTAVSVGRSVGVIINVRKFETQKIVPIELLEKRGKGRTNASAPGTPTSILAGWWF